MCVYKMISKLHGQIINVFMKTSQVFRRETIILMTLHEPGRRSDSMKPAVLLVDPVRMKTRRPVGPT